ncbi:hypothetical protein H4S07_001336 [Coemansia furcata]|uniref:Uncharacterized protein n=1 Tax=Coemansia furcata TaxID=417177 RepID=A0ACC1LNK8_9FUNG|nr:hypothetical protein H4S07_001336 [Coemansia furcata]
MDTLSAFQLLPPHVVKLIVDHVSGSSRLQFDCKYKDEDSDEYEILQKPLLSVCHNFRAIVHQRFCRKYALILRNGSDSAEVWFSSWPGCRLELGYPAHHLAKELWFRVDLESVYSGKALQMLSAAPYEGCAFPLVRKLTFDLVIDLRGRYDWELESDDTDSDDDDDDDQESERDDGYPTQKRYIYPQDTTANIAAFAQRVKQMAPTVSEMDVIPHDEAERLFQRGNVHILHLAEELFRIVEKHTVITRGSDPFVMYMDLKPIRDLVRIEYFMDSYFSDVMPLICRSARTLQSLDIDVGDADVSGLFRAPGGRGCLGFPRMHTLKIRASRNYKPPHKAVFKNIVPFPRLQRLSATSDCPFSDDVLFRGNAGTLEFLELELAPETVSMLRTYKTLSLPGTTLSLIEAFSLIKSLPLLSDLHTSPLTVGEPPQGVSMAKLPSHVRAAYAPIGKRFHCWHVKADWGTEVNYVELAIFMLLLALACPNFDYAAVERKYREPFMMAMKEMIDEPGFNQDAPRLRRLLFHGRKSC